MSLPAAQAVNGLLGLLRFDPALYAVFEIWDRETSGIVKGCEAAGIQGTTLCVKVPSAVHRQELMYSKDRIIQRVNQALGRRVITGIQFELASQPSAATSDRTGGNLSVQNKTRFGFHRDGKR